jgi:hypothetical protein
MTRRCRLCGVEDEGVAPGMIRFRRDETPERIEHVAADRCQDRNECAKRVEESGRKWPALDAGAVIS